MDSPSDRWKWRLFIPTYGLVLFAVLVLLVLIALAAAPPSPALYYLSSVRDRVYLTITDTARGLSVPLVRGDAYAPVALEAAPDGGTLADITLNEGRATLHLMAYNGTQRRSLAARPANAADLDWSPDGTHLIFTARLPGQTATDLFTIDTRDGTLTNLSNTPETEMRPVWSPDGTQIAYLRVTPGDHVDIYVIELARDATVRGVAWRETPEPRNLTNDSAPENDPQWSPDGTQIAYLSDRGNGSDIYVIDTRNGQRRQITTTPVPESWPRWSPDGRYLAYVQQTGSRRALMLYDFTSDESRPLVRGLIRGGLPVWSPDGAVIAFAAPGAGRAFDVYTVNPVNGVRRLITPHYGSHYGPVWSTR